jgi:hypothetical protein
MQVLIKVLISVTVILVATSVGEKRPSAAGLIDVMPFTGDLVLVWMHLENNGDPHIMQDSARGALWGIFTQHPLFPGGIFLLQKTAFPSHRSRIKLWHMAYCCLSPSVGP